MKHLTVYVQIQIKEQTALCCSDHMMVTLSGETWAAEPTGSRR